MTREDLFLAIGQVEERRLARSEERRQIPSRETEETDMKKRTGNPKRMIRNLLIAAVIVSLLAVTAYAVAGFVIFESPEELVTAIFGDETGFDHSDGGEKYFEDGSLAAVEPTFDRVPVDETVAKEDIVPNVEAVGQTLSWKGYTLTVDSFLYDSATRCGFLTYLLENPEGLPEYKLQTTGEIWYDGAPDIVTINQDGYPYIIREKTTDNRLAATFYFKWDERFGEELEIALQSQKRYTPDEFAAMIADDVEKRKQELSPEEAVEAVRLRLGEEVFARAYQGLTEEEIAEQCYLNLVALETEEQLEKDGTSQVISIPLNQEQTLHHISAGEGSVTVTPISLRIDISNLAFLHTDSLGRNKIHSDNIRSIVIRDKTGEEYTVIDGYTVNYAFAVSELPPENVQTEVFVSPEEDPYGEGYFYVENSHDYCILTVMFNRIIDVDAISAVLLNGVEVPLDK